MLASTRSLQLKRSARSPESSSAAPILTAESVAAMASRPSSASMAGWGRPTSSTLVTGRVAGHARVDDSCRHHGVCSCGITEQRCARPSISTNGSSKRRSEPPAREERTALDPRRPPGTDRSRECPPLGEARRQRSARKGTGERPSSSSRSPRVYCVKCVEKRQCSSHPASNFRAGPDVDPRRGIPRATILAFGSTRVSAEPVAGRCRISSIWSDRNHGR